MNSVLRHLEAPAHTRDWGVAVLRVVMGFAMFMHGWQKVFQMGFPGVTRMLGQMGAPAPEVTGPLIAVLELAGGAALVVGLGTRGFALLLAIDMLSAILIAHLPFGFYPPMGFELPLLFLGGMVALILAGPGAFALDRALLRARPAPAVASPRREVASAPR